MKKNYFLYPLFAITIFFGSFLLFQVQPIIGKYILPWFGGTSFVWITSLLFFETLLLAGYYYAYLLTKLSTKSQFFLHALLILASFCLILFFFSFRKSPIMPGLWEKPPDNFPTVVQVLIILFISVGLPYFLLASTSTLLQRWFSFFPHNKSPYSLYALSNVGSLLGLISYPFLVEPLLTLNQQGVFWSKSFLIVCLLLFLSSGYAFLLQKNTKVTIAKQTLQLSQTTKKHLLLWFGLPAISSSMLLAATYQMTQAIAPIPFLWLLPLCLYLVSFILCFSEKNYYYPTPSALLYFVSMILVLAILLQSIVISVVWQLLIYSSLLFSGFMLCHGELYAKRPDAKQLNTFYLLISLGSVLGAIIVAIIAPIFFIGLYLELYLALYATATIAGYVLFVLQKTFSKFFYKTFSSQKEIALFIFSITTFFFITIAIMSYVAQKENSVGIWRNFYGTLWVTHRASPNGTIACLLNGKIIHGCQYLDKNLKNQPLTYFGKNSGIMLGIQSLRARNNNLRIGIIGLGVGTLAAYGKKGDDITFYELNPQDINIAKTQFTYLSDSPAHITVIPGDGRLSVAKNMQKNGPAKDNLFVIDAFNDDAIPVHLLTKEAFDLYRQNVVPKNSIIAVHISTTYVDLSPVIMQLAQHYHMAVAIIMTPGLGQLTTSRWALLADDPKLLQTNEILKREQDPTNIRNVQLWTDDYSNIFQLLRY